jgi:methylaspartate ammonia-lyase
MVRANVLRNFDLQVVTLKVYPGNIAAITNCTTILTDLQGEFRLTAIEALNAFSDLSLYRNAESCPMVRLYHLQK